MPLRSDLPRANFTITPRAVAAIDDLRRWWDSQVADPARVPAVAWGEYHLNTGERFSRVVISFYTDVEFDDIEEAIQEVSGVPLVFFVHDKDVFRFQGKALDFDEASGFHLRD